MQTKKTVKLLKADSTQFRKQLHEKFPDIPKTKICFSYKLKKKGNSYEEYVVETDDTDDSLEDFYTMTSNMSEVQVFSGKKVSELTDDEELILSKAYVLSKSVPRQSGRNRWRERAGFAPNMLSEEPQCLNA